MFFILISINLIVYIVSIKFMLLGVHSPKFYTGFILLWVGLFITGCICSMYLKKSQRISQLNTPKKSKLNMNKDNKSTLNMNKNNGPQQSQSYFFADCLDCGDCVDIFDVFTSDCSTVHSGTDCGFMDITNVDCINADCSGADCSGADCSGADCSGF